LTTDSSPAILKNKLPKRQPTPAAIDHFARPHGRASLAGSAYLIIRDRILKGDLALGSALSRRKLAAELNMSLLPVSEALQKLENDGLVESRPRIGTRVCSPSPKDIRERYEVREALESQAARLFAEKASALERLELQKMAENMDAMFNQCTPGSTDPDFLYAVHSFHLQLHLRIAECTGCRALSKAVEKNQVLIFNWLYDVASRRPALPPRFHRDLIEVICNGGPEEADRAMRLHIRHAVDFVARAIRPAASGKTNVIEPIRP
jgi:DNA-binding GntR family transcriptional regulator